MPGTEGVWLNLTPLKEHRDFRLYYLGQFVSVFGSAITFVVLPWQMYQLTGSTAAVGLLGVAEFLPMLMVGLFGGALADSMPRRRLLRLTECALLAGCLLLVGNSMLARPSVPFLYGMAVYMAGLGALYRPAKEAYIQQLVPREHLASVSALRTMYGNFGHIAGPALAGVLVAKLGPRWAFSLDALTYAVSLTALWLIRNPGAVDQGEGVTWKAITEGFRYARSRQVLMGTYVVDMVAMFFGMPMALFPAMSKQWGESQLGLLYAMPAAGALVCSLFSGWTRRVERHGLAITLAALLWGVGIIVFGAANSLWLALAGLAFAGAADNISGIFRLTIWNHTIPTNLRGRMAGIEMISYLSGPYLGNAEAGLAAEWLGVQRSVILGGMLCLVGVGLVAILLPESITYRDQPHPAGRGIGSEPRPEG